MLGNEEGSKSIDLKMVGDVVHGNLPNGLLRLQISIIQSSLLTH